MKRLCVGIVHLTQRLRSLLDQTGIWYEQIDPESNLLKSYSVIISNDQAIPLIRSRLMDYVRSGGAVIELPNGHLFYQKDSIVSKKTDTIINEDRDSFLGHIPHLDLFRPVEFHRKGGHLDGLVHFENIYDGFSSFIGLDFEELFHDIHYTRKRFFYNGENDPDEIVSTVSKYELSEILIAVLKELHFLQDLPFIKKSDTPEDKPVFCFRVDSDYGDKESVERLYQLCDKYKIPATWFLHVEAHEHWLSVFSTFSDQEIALHGYEHGTSTSYETVFHNIEKGLQLLKFENINPLGFCAPYGIWNNTLADVLKKFAFRYTSEFTFCHDGLPFFPVNEEDEPLPLQIPIHPVCTGSLSRKRIPESQMFEYFENVMQNKVARIEPVLFYHHPLQPGLEVLEEIFKKVNELELVKMTFNDFTSFWKRRNGAHFEAYFDPEKQELKTNCFHYSIPLFVSYDHKSGYLTQSGVKLKELEPNETFYFGEQYLPDKEQIEAMHSDSFSLLKTSFLDWKNRNHL